jgi:hypothetical protein
LSLLSALSFCSLRLPCFYRQNTGEKEDVVATMLSPLHRPSNMWKVVGCVGVFLKGSRRLFQGEVGENRGKKILLLPLPRASRGRRRSTVPSKRHRFRPSFFLMNIVWNGAVLAKTCRFIQMKTTPNLFQSTNQSSICDLFNRVLNWNFDFKNLFNCIPAKFNRRPWSWPPFSNWSLVSN